MTDLIYKDLKNNRDGIVKELAKKDWNHFKLYFEIVKKYSSNNIDSDFQKTFCKFYILNGARGLNDIQKKKFFEILRNKKDVDLEFVLKELYKIPGYKNSKRLFLSFATKLLHTQDNKLPIYDGNIAKVLKLKRQNSSGDSSKKIKNRIEIYQQLRDKSKELLLDKDIKQYLRDIRTSLWEMAKEDNFGWQNKYLSDEKLLDSVLWALYTVK
jgi:hypothetical protein